MKTILLIEDDIVLRENTAELLELSNYKVLTAPNGSVGVGVAKKSLPDIIVCDIMMPELDGYGVLEALSKHQETKNIPFIYLSAKTEQQDVRKGMNLGADDYLTKPYNETDLISAIESRLAKASILKESNNASNPSDTENNELRTLNDLKNFLDDNGETVHYSEGDSIYKEGDHSNTIYLISSGIVKCHKLDEKGKELITALYKEDDLFGYTSFIQNIPYQESATAIKNSTLVSVSKVVLKEVLIKNHEVAIELMELLTDNLFNVKNQLLQMAYGSVNQKTAQTIIKFSERLNRKPGDAIRISRSDLASVAGIATETLIRTMTLFKKQGLIEIEGRNIKILDLERLKEIY
ncbi:response regulator [Xanthomarina sp. F1114]|uniref:response regulator n=1 Tax=Xanthomarina sp. F1114 TaxID=2996019 RepID=UPI00225E39C5|nr:response regulator [Xanthomarina sp. F1114]MCX7546716.1 response regulator [Xanthomarina sp. F1114]